MVMAELGLLHFHEELKSELCTIIPFEGSSPVSGINAFFIFIVTQVALMTGL
jgi:hypothetical protein